MIENLGIQLYTLRNEMTDEESVREGFKKIKEIGYNHIQPASMCNLTPERFASLASEAGLTAAKCGTISAWSQVLGGGVQAYTKNLFIKNQVLYVTLTSAVLRHELMMNRRSLVQRLNSHVKAQVITNIIFR